MRTRWLYAVRGRLQDGRYQYIGALWDILYELASASDLLLPGSRDKESTGSSTFADYSDWVTYADPQRQLYALPINRTDLGRIPLHGQVNQISDWYSANLYSCYCRRDNVMILIWERTSSGLKYISARPITAVTLPFCTLTTSLYIFDALPLLLIHARPPTHLWSSPLPSLLNSGAIRFAAVGFHSLRDGRYSCIFRGLFS
ncbi:hypothetical protein ARMGADRAFT_346464 [Armillaria gallica]|uniref:Uncharacterized protein n=1 Tax=Armillaria gallica TaxID=47427 RepID=A0A2H3D0W2_ARMGA|nr:hypothetical protein ARMGADRAFT_346464 [Armillaria gallica]